MSLSKQGIYPGLAEVVRHAEGGMCTCASFFQKTRIVKAVEQAGWESPQLSLARNCTSVEALVSSAVETFPISSDFLSLFGKEFHCMTSTGLILFTCEIGGMLASRVTNQPSSGWVVKASCLKSAGLQFSIMTWYIQIKLWEYYMWS